jgi:hypothetical protein
MAINATGLGSLTNATTLSDLFVYANEVTNSHFTGLMMIAFAFVLFIALKKFTARQAYMTTSLVCIVVGVLLYMADLLNFSYLAMFIGIGAVIFAVEAYNASK